METVDGFSGAILVACGGATVTQASAGVADAETGTLCSIGTRFQKYVFDAAGSGRIWEAASAEVLAAVHQTWLRDPVAGSYLLDVFREPHDGDTWIYRRDERIRLPYSDIILRTPDGIPYLAPELVLLFKAKHLRPKDQSDFDATVPHMTLAQRETLAGLLARAHPGHPWIEDL
ncbi:MULTISPECIES: hypothetical protein [unclassified Streptomyces]|uniref:hypothetical protein n=1 Tax=unclassified Streptomyces TaxID=2593676 RepID=UPI003426CA71